MFGGFQNKKLTSHGNLDGHPLNHFLLEEFMMFPFAFCFTFFPICERSVLISKEKQESFNLFSTDVVLGKVKSTSGDDQVQRDRFS